MTKTYTPTFPEWSDVAISLFRDEHARTQDETDSSLKSFLELITSIPNEYELPPSGLEQIELSQKSMFESNIGLRALSEAEVRDQIGDLPFEQNQFYLVGNTRAFEFIWVSENTKDLIGLASNEDFTFMKICGMDDRDELYHPEDVEHIIRFGTCAMIIIAISGFEVSPFTDYYEVSFRIGWSDETKHKTIRRRCHLSNWPQGEGGTRHFDTWSVTNGYDRFDHLHWHLHYSDPKAMAQLNGMFYILNCVLIGITPQEAILANLLTLHDTQYMEVLNNEIAKALRLDDFKYESRQTYFNQKSQLKKKIDKLILHTTRGSRFKSNPSKNTFHFRCGQIGILGMDLNLMDCIWKNVV